MRAGPKGFLTASPCQLRRWSAWLCNRMLIPLNCNICMLKIGKTVDSRVTMAKPCAMANHNRTRHGEG